MNTPEATANAESETVTELKALLLEAEQALNSVVGKSDAKFAGLLARLRETLSDDEGLRKRLLGRAQQGIKRVDNVVRENPYYAIGIAAGVGAIASILVSRSCSHSH